MVSGDVTVRSCDVIVESRDVIVGSCDVFICVDPVVMIFTMCKDS